MNIFVLDENPIEAARLQCDMLVTKMILESAQMLSTAHRLIDGDNNVDSSLYKSTHKNHPCSIWCRETSGNYEWLYNHFIALCDEYIYRYNKRHLTDTKFRDALSKLPKAIKKADRTQFVTVMTTIDPSCIDPDNPVEAYRVYYQSKRSKFVMKWTKREIPQWFYE